MQAEIYDKSIDLFVLLLLLLCNSSQTSKSCPVVVVSKLHCSAPTRDLLRGQQLSLPSGVGT